MSTADPFLPAPWPAPQQRDAAEIDLDHDVDVILPGDDAAEEDASADVAFPENPAFRPPTPGIALTKEELEADLDDD